MPESVFASYIPQRFPHRFEGTIHVGCIAAGIPANPKVAEGWLKTRLADKDDLIRQAVAEVMAETGAEFDQAVDQLDEKLHLNVFKRDELGLYIPGYYLKAGLKAAANIAASSGAMEMRGWGKTKKYVMGWVAEHVIVVEDRLHLGVAEPTGVAQRFPHTRNGNGIQYEEYVEDAKFDFTVTTDHDFTEEQWATLWLTAEQEGIGATRSQGYGRYTVTRWDRVS